MVNENAAHHLCRHAKEMGTVLLLHLFLVHESQICFVNQRGGLQGVIGAFSTKLVVSQMLQLTINKRYEAVQGAFKPLCQIISCCVTPVCERWTIMTYR
jgi:hypothetical protein